MINNCFQEVWWRPGVGETSCFLSSDGSSQLIYFHVPVMVMVKPFMLVIMIIIFEGFIC